MYYYGLLVLHYVWCNVGPIYFFSSSSFSLSRHYLFSCWQSKSKSTNMYSCSWLQELGDVEKNYDYAALLFFSAVTVNDIWISWISKAFLLVCSLSLFYIDKLLLRISKLVIRPIKLYWRIIKLYWRCIYIDFEKAFYFYQTDLSRLFSC